MPRVLIVDDSPTARLALKRALRGREGLEVVGEAAGGGEGLRLVRSLRPDVVLMDVELGGENGVEVTAELMAASPTRVLIVTGTDPRDPSLAFRAVEAGALEVLGKPPGPSHAGYEAYRRRLVRTVEAMAQVPVVTRRRSAPRLGRAPRPRATEAPGGFEVVVIGASTGGPPVLRELLAAMGPRFALPVAVVQHIVHGFTGGLATWLRETTDREVIVCDGVRALEPGEVYLAPDGAHLELLRPRRVGPVAGPPRGFQRPSIDALFESAASLYGPRAIAVLLTGMGEDGAAGALAIKRRGGRVLVQDPATCAIDSMPSAVIRRAAADEVLAPRLIGGLLGELAASRALPEVMR